MTTQGMPQDPQPSAPSSQLLPYATGMHYADRAPPAEFFRDGDVLIVSHGSTLPERCILCGEQAAGKAIRLVFTWDSSFQMTNRSTLELRKKVHVHAFLCAAHRARWHSARHLGGVGAACSVLLMLAGMTVVGISENTAFPEYTQPGIILILFGFACTIISLFYFTLRSRTLSCRKIQEGYIYLDGAGEAFLEGLPPVPAAK